VSAHSKIFSFTLSAVVHGEDDESAPDARPGYQASPAATPLRPLSITSRRGSHKKPSLLPRPPPPPPVALHENVRRRNLAAEVFLDGHAEGAETRGLEVAQALAKEPFMSTRLRDICSGLDLDVATCHAHPSTPKAIIYSGSVDCLGKLLAWLLAPFFKIFVCIYCSN
jgi:hypothetical protein